MSENNYLQRAAIMSNHLAAQNPELPLEAVPTGTRAVYASSRLRANASVHAALVLPPQSSREFADLEPAGAHRSPDDVVIVSAFRTPIGKAKRGAFKVRQNRSRARRFISDLGVVPEGLAGSPHPPHSTNYQD